MQQQTVSHPVSLFCVAAPADEALLTQWEAHLFPLQQAGLLTFWSERHLQAGADRITQRSVHLDQADSMVLLLSADFFADDDCMILMNEALLRQQQNRMRVIPLLVRPVEWRDSPLGTLASLPANQVAITTWKHQDDGWQQAVQGLRHLLGQTLLGREGSMSPPTQATKRGYIFLSYRSIEADFALQLATDLKNAGINLWIDRLDGITAGDNWRQAIERAVNDSVAMITVLSPDYVTAEYCRKELERANDLHLPVIPILLRSLAQKDWPLTIQGLHYIDFRNWHNPVSYQDQFHKLFHLLQTEFNTQVGGAPDREVQYLTSLIADLDKHKGVLEYVQLAGDADTLRERPNPMRPPHEWPSEFALLLEQRAGEKGLRHSREDEKIPIPDIRQGFQQHPRCVLLGEPGAGKTSTLRRLARDAAIARLANPHTAPLPLLLYLPRWTDEPTPEDFIRKQWPFTSDLAVLLVEGEVLLFLDGLNEMGADGPRKVHLLNEWLHGKHAPQRIILTCRITDYDENLNVHLPQILVQEMNEQQIRQFVHNYLNDKAEPLLKRLFPEQDWDRDEVHSLLHLAENPYLLAALIFVSQSTSEEDLPRNNGALFRRVVQTLWERERQKGTPGWIPFDQMEEAFSHLALAMIDEEQPVDVPLEYAWTRIRSKTKFWQGRSTSNALLWAGQNANLVAIIGDHVRFYHQLLQEYFAAVRLEQLGFQKKLFYRRAMQNYAKSASFVKHLPPYKPTDEEWFYATEELRKKWEQVILALAGIASNVDATINQLVKIDPLLAARCLSTGINTSEQAKQNTTLHLLGPFEFQNRSYNYYRPFIEALGQTGSPFAAEKLVELLYSHSDYVVRDDASIALRSMEPLLTVPALIHALDSGVLQEYEDTGYYEVISTIVCINEIDIVPLFLSLLCNKDRLIRLHTLRNLPSRVDFAFFRPAVWRTLSDPDDLVRNAAMQILKIGVDDREQPGVFSNDLLYDLHHPDAHVRWSATRTLGKLGDSRAISWLKEALADKDAHVRWAVVEALGKLGNQTIVPDILTTLHDPDDGVRWHAVEALGKIGSSRILSELLSVLHDPDRFVRRKVVEVLKKERNPVTVSGLLAVIQDVDRDVRLKAVEALGEIGDPTAVAGLLKTLSDPDGSVRRAVVESFGRIGGSDAVFSLSDALTHKGLSSRVEAAEALGEIGDPAAIAGLLKIISDPDEQVRCAVVKALGKIGDSASVPGLLKALRDQADDVRRYAAEALGEIGDPIAVSELLSTLHDPGYFVRPAAAKSLRTISGSTALSGLLGTLHNPAKSIRSFGAETLGEMGDSAAVPELLGVLQDPDHDVRWQAIKALGKIGDPHAVSDLLDALHNIDGYERSAAAEALGKIGDPHAVEPLYEALKDTDYFVRERAAEALNKIRGVQPTTSHRSVGYPSGILNQLSHEEATIYMTAIQSLKQIGGTEGLLMALRYAAGKSIWKVAEELTQIPTNDLRLLLSEITESTSSYRERAFIAYALGEHGRKHREAGLLQHPFLDTSGKLVMLETHLLQVLVDASPLVRYFVAEALGKLGCSSAVPQLSERLTDQAVPFSDRQIRVCEAAAAALINIGTPEALASVARWKTGFLEEDLTANDEKDS